jgi:bifunctional DNA-binding transcriptional regulator/antitoxin component of YhaV-PrlF toxin-antitoxin module
MPHISKGGKYIFGWSKIRDNGEVLIPNEAVREYHLEVNEKVFLISGSKATGGFAVAKKEYLEQSEIGQVLKENPKLAEFQIDEGRAVKSKGRLYCWVSVHDKGVLALPLSTRQAFAIKPDAFLLSIRGSDVAFVMGVKGPIIETAKKHPEILVFE